MFMPKIDFLFVRAVRFSRLEILKHLNNENGHKTWSLECQESLYRWGILKTVLRKLVKCKLDLAAVQEVRWDKVALNQYVNIYSAEW
jgi:hypothetical protein